VLGFFAYMIVSHAFYKFMHIAFGMEVLGLQDASFLHENKDNLNFVVTAMITEKFKYEEMKKFYLERSRIVDKAQHKLVQALGLFWYKKMSDDEWKAYEGTFLTHVEGKKNKK